MMFSLGFTGFIGSYHEQRSAIEAAGLAVAKDISGIVIDDPNFGLVGLSDSSPIGTNTSAQDGFRTEVIGINTLLGTIRLDLIISDYLQDPIMNKMALNDYNKALQTQQALVTALNSVIAGGTANDCNGNLINPLQDAIQAYNSNKVHLVMGQSSTLITNTLTLTLGYVDGLATRTAVPQPQSIANLTSSQMQQGFYTSNVSAPYDNQPFVFAALGSNATLVDFRAFQTSISGLPYSTPTVVKIEADELYKSDTSSRTVHAVAAAVAGTVTDQRPYPGAFTISFPDGPPPEISSPGDLINNVQIQADPTDSLQTAAAGDYPQTALSFYTIAGLPDPDPNHPQFENVLSTALYDWLKRGGVTVNVQSLITTLETPLTYKTGAQIQRLHLTSSGAVTVDSVTMGQTDLSVSNKQFRATSGLGIVSTNGNSYDLQITDFVHVPGRTNGGLHAGEPLNYPGQNVSNPAAASYVSGAMYENTTWLYEAFLSGSNAIRPTYNSEGIGIDFTIRMRH